MVDLSQNQQQNKMYYPMCGSTKLATIKKRFGAEKTLTGAVLTEGKALLAGFTGNNNAKINYLKYDANFKPAEIPDTPPGVNDDTDTFLGMPILYQLLV